MPTFGNGKICYIGIPANDPAASANFYRTVFGWSIRESDNGRHISFDDGVGEVSGMWMTGCQPQGNTGMIISIMVDDMATTLALVTANGGKIIQQPADLQAREVIASFSDPVGNVWSLYQHRG